MKFHARWQHLALCAAALSVVACEPAVDKTDTPASSTAAEPETAEVSTEPEPFCPENTNADWRNAQMIDGVEIAASPVCAPDNPFFVAAVVRGTNNIGMQDRKSVV